VPLRARRRVSCGRSGNRPAGFSAQLHSGTPSRFSILPERDPQLIPVFPDKRDAVDIWLVLHPDLQKVARIMAVITVLEQCFMEESRASE